MPEHHVRYCCSGKNKEEYTIMEKKDFRAYVGNDEQVYGVRRVILDEGNARGISMYQVTTAGGLELDILPDSGLDIGRVRFKGVNISYTTKNGYDSPVRFLPVPGEFGRYFPGGHGAEEIGKAGAENAGHDDSQHHHALAPAYVLYPAVLGGRGCRTGLRTDGTRGRVHDVADIHALGRHS